MHDGKDTFSDLRFAAREISGSKAGFCTGIACDLVSLEAISSLAREVAERFGALHTLVNNAGAVAPGPLEAVREQDWDRVVDVNLKAAFFMTQQPAPYLRKAASADWPASATNIASFAGNRVGPRPHYPYTAAKAALRYLTQSLAKELARDHVKVNAIALGVSREIQ